MKPTASLARRRRLYVAAAGAVTVALAALLDLHPALRLLLPLAAVPLGAAMGRRAWDKVRARIDSRRVVILYFTDSKFYLVLVALFFLKTFKLLAFRIAWWATVYAVLAEALALVVAGAWCGHAWTFWRLAVEDERRHGPLRFKTFYGRSVTGQQGMIGLHGTVTRVCSPRGKVELRGEIWEAETLDGSTIDNGATVAVRDIDEMTLRVEAVSD